MYDVCFSSVPPSHIHYHTSCYHTSHYTPHTTIHTTPSHLTTTPSQCTTHITPPLPHITPHPSHHHTLPERLLHMLHGILLHQQMRHPGAPKSPVATTPAPPLNMAFHESDNAMVTLALQTLSSFSFGGEDTII